MDLSKYKLIAEISANHNGSLTKMKKLIQSAKINGADLIKIQTYDPDTITLKSKNKYFKIKNGPWKNNYLWNLYNEGKTPRNWHKEIFNFAKKLKIKIFSTPFHETDVDFLETLNCPIYKVASFEMNHLPLIEKIAKTGKPLIISTGMANIQEIEEAYRTARKYKASDITLLYCVSNYPSKLEDFNLNNINILKKEFKCRVGFSDHSNDDNIAYSAALAGAEIFEKHFALKSQKKGLDLNFSSKGKELKKYKRKINLAFKMLGKSYFYRNKSEDKSLIFRRSIFSVKKIDKGEKLTKQNIKIIRPGYGIKPKYYNSIIDKKAKKNIDIGTPILFNLIK